MIQCKYPTPNLGANLQFSQPIMIHQPPNTHYPLHTHFNEHSPQFDTHLIVAHHVMKTQTFAPLDPIKFEDLRSKGWVDVMGMVFCTAPGANEIFPS